MKESQDFWCFSMTELGISTHASPEGSVKGVPFFESCLEDPLKRFSQLLPPTVLAFISGTAACSAIAGAGFDVDFSGSVVFTTFAVGSSEDSLPFSNFFSDGLGSVGFPELALAS